MDKNSLNKKELKTVALPDLSSSAPKEDPRRIFCPEYTNRWGKRMIASDYGYTTWSFVVK